MKIEGQIHSYSFFFPNEKRLAHEWEGDCFFFREDVCFLKKEEKDL